MSTSSSAPPTPMGQSPALSAPFVGRERELAALLAAWEQTVAGSGRVALLAGEAGVGKSRLAREAAAQAQAVTPGRLLLRGGSIEQDRAIPFAPVIALLRDLAAQERAAGAAADPEDAELLAQLTGRSAAPPDEPARLFWRLLDRFGRAAALRPLLVIVEDIHWCDSASLDFFAFWVHRIAHDSLCLLFTFRDEEAQSGPAAQFLATAARAAQTIELRLSRLTAAQTQTLLNGLLGAAAPAAAPGLAERLYHFTDGNPFFVEETMRSLLSSNRVFHTGAAWDRVPLDALEIPRSVQAAVRQRVARLSDGARGALQAAAVVGRRVSYELLARILEAEDMALLAWLDEILAAHLLVEEETNRYAFRHALAQAAVYGELRGRMRELLHRRVAQALLEQTGETPAGPALADLAYHFSRAGDLEQALTYGRAAGEAALRLHSPQTAAAHLSAAVAAAERLGRGDPALYHTLAQAYDRMGAFAPARAAYEQAIALAQAQGETIAEAQALLDLGFLWTQRDLGQAHALLQQAVARARQAGEPRILAHSLNRLGNWHANREAPAAAIPLHREALALCERIADAPGMAVSLDLLCMGHLIAGDVLEAAPWGRRAAELFRAADNRVGLASLLAVLTMTGGSYVADTSPTQVMPLAECLALGEEAVRLARETGWLPGEAGVSMQFGLALGVRGQWARVQRLGAQALAIARALDHRLWISASLMLLGRLHLDVGDPARAEPELAEALETAQAAGSAFLSRAAAAFLAMAYTAQDAVARADRLLAPLLATLPAQPATQMERLLLCTAAEAELARGDTHAARRKLEALLAGGSAPRIELARARLLALEKQRGQALRLLEQAAHLAQRHGFLPMCRLILLEAARIAQATGVEAHAF
ncbi:MAG TPA: AAA family ATPase, partial [Caldilineaceae bacterium]|nr:AAA family ATPase [Caldilineaceae bacterium]